jgi:uncharacterized SAM-binding protein YcdF (DUF218 family)
LSKGRSAAATLRRILRFYLLGVGLATTVVVAWLASPLPLLVNRPLVWNDPPAPADAIVCLGSGIDDGLPSATGWQRIRTSARLYRAGFAPVILFSGGAVSGSERSVAEVYAEAAQLMGVPASACLLEPLASNTADHPARLLATDLLRARGGTATRLLVVTTAYHGRRVGLCFRKAGFSRTRIITEYEAQPSKESKDDPPSLQRHFANRLYAGLAALQEWSALAAYKARGWI